MIIREITVAGWRCFFNEVTVGSFSDGINIIHAPNGTGKSRLFEAMQMALLDNHAVTGNAINEIQPWGRELTPRVIIEFEHEGEAYRITKQFINKQYSVLEREEEGRYQNIAEDSAADEHTRVMLSSDGAKKGLAKLEHFGVAQVLWAPQGQIALEELSVDLVGDIRQLLNAQVGAEGGGTLEQRIREEYSRVFTNAGKLKKGKDAPPQVRQEKELDEAKQKLVVAKYEYQAFEETARAVEDLQAKQQRAQHVSAELKARLGITRELAERYRELVAERENRLASLKAAKAQFENLERKVKEIAQTEADLARQNNEFAELDVAIAGLERELVQLAQKKTEAQTQLEEARKDRNKVEDAETLAKHARMFVEAQRQLEELDTQIAEIKAEQAALDEWSEKLGNVQAPSQKEMQQLREAIRQHSESKVKLTAALVKLELVPEDKQQIDVIAGEQPGELTLPAGVPSEVLGSPEIVAQLPGWGRIRVHGPAGSIDEYREEVQEAQLKMDEFAERYGSDDPEIIEQLRDKSSEFADHVKEHQTRLKVLEKGGDLQQLREKRAAQAAIHNRMLESHSGWDNEKPDAAKLENEYERVKGEFVSNIEKLEPIRDKAVEEHRSAEGLLERQQDKKERVRAYTDQLKTKLADLTSDGLGPADREEKLNDFAMDRREASARLGLIEDELKDFAGDPSKEMVQLERQRTALDEDAAELREKLIAEETKLSELSKDGTYTKLVQLEEQIVQFETDLRVEERRNNAIKLLFETVNAVRSEELSTVLAPVEKLATNTFHRIAGARAGRVQFGESFAPNQVQPDGTDEPVDIANLSGGEQEQLYLATRLALAEMLARDERQLVVLDDILAYTDTGRFARVLNVIEEAAQKLQILILTCHPERYRGLEHSSSFDLADLKLKS